MAVWHQVFDPLGLGFSRRLTYRTAPVLAFVLEQE